MRYVATLQRFDDAHVDVAESDSRAEAVTAATIIYAALVPTIIGHGIDELSRDLAQLRQDFGEDSDDYREMHAAASFGNTMSAQLRAREWGVGVYDTEADEPGSTTAPTPKTDVPQLIFWLGATREQPRLNRKGE